MAAVQKTKKKARQALCSKVEVYSTLIGPPITLNGWYQVDSPSKSESIHWLDPKGPYNLDRPVLYARVHVYERPLWTRRTVHFGLIGPFTLNPLDRPLLIEPAGGHPK